MQPEAESTATTTDDHLLYDRGHDWITDLIDGVLHNLLVLTATCEK